MFERTIALVVEHSKGPCSCERNCGSCSSGTWDLTTGQLVPGHYDPGPVTRVCDRCKARRALDEDGVVYEKDDRPQWAPWMRGMNINCVPMMNLGTVITGTTHLSMLGAGVK